MSIFSQFLKRSSPQQGIVLYYIVAIVVAFLLLNLPYVHKPGVEVNPIDTLFVAVSGISVTRIVSDKYCRYLFYIWTINYPRDIKYWWNWRHGNWYDVMGGTR